MQETLEKIKNELVENSFEVDTREYGRVEVVGVDAINDVIDKFATEPAEASDDITVCVKIPKEFIRDYKADGFKEFFERVACDTKDGVLCGRYEQETIEMFKKAFEESLVGGTNG